MSQGSECDTTLAPEVWSQPIRLPEVINQRYVPNYFPSLSHDGKTLYFTRLQTVYKTALTDTGWASPVRLSNSINRGLVQSPSLSPDGKKLYFVAWTTGGWAWDIWVSTWSDSLSDWGESVHLDTTINSPYNEWTVHIAADGNHLYFASDAPLWRDDWNGNTALYVCAWNNNTQSWGPKEYLGRNINYNNVCLGGSSTNDGAALTADGRKLYFSKWMWKPYNFDLYVAYRDSSGNWQKAKRLNINAVADTGTIDPSRDITGWDLYPTVSPDGKTLYFSSRRQAYLYGTDDAIWMSRLLVDENGDTVITSGHEEKAFEPIKYHLYQNYPNPFNPLTVIEYAIPKRGHVELKIFDTLGREVKTLVSEQQEPGRYRVPWNGRDGNNVQVSSGVYFYTIQTEGGRKTKKMLTIH